MDLDLNLGLARHLGMRFIEATPDRVVAELEIREQVSTLGGSIHGGTAGALTSGRRASRTRAASCCPLRSRPR